MVSPSFNKTIELERMDQRKKLHISRINPSRAGLLTQKKMGQIATSERVPDKCKLLWYNAT